MSTSERALVVLPRTLFGRIATGLRAFRRLIRNPADPLHGPLFQMCAEHSLLRRLTRRLERHGEGQRLLAERPRLTAGSVSLASTCPPRSLGRAYAGYFTANGITPFDPPALPVETNQDYVATRLREAHDVFHVVTGYGTDEIGELELQWFNLGNLGWGPLPFIMLVAFCFMGHAKRHGGLWAVFKRARAAYRRGKQSRALAGMYWEDYWHLPLCDVRTLLCAPVEARASSS